MRTLKPVLTNKEIDEIYAAEYCDAPVVVDDTPYFMDSILDIQLSEAEEIERWEDGAEIFGFASYVNDTATGMAA